MVTKWFIFRNIFQITEFIDFIFKMLAESAGCFQATPAVKWHFSAVAAVWHFSHFMMLRDIHLSRAFCDWAQWLSHRTCAERLFNYYITIRNLWTWYLSLYKSFSALPPLCESFQMRFGHKQRWSHYSHPAHLKYKIHVSTFKHFHFCPGLYNLTFTCSCNYTYIQPLTICLAQASYTCSCVVFGGRTRSKI